MRPHFIALALGISGLFLVTLSAHDRADAIQANPTGAVQAENDPIVAELDAFWAEAARTVAEGDHESMVAQYHPDGVHVGGTLDSYRTRLFSDNHENLAAGNAETRSGARSPGIEFRFSSRVHSENTAHEVGLYHFWMERPGEPHVDSYGVVDAYLVKKDGRWMFLVSIQRETSTKDEWDALQ